MNILALGITAIMLYLAAASGIAVKVFRGPAEQQALRLPMLGLGFLAIALHAIILYKNIITGAGLNLGVSNAASLVAWLIALLILTASFRRPLENLAVILLPIAALAIGLELLFPGHRLLPENAPMGLQVHVTLSLLSYSLLTIAAVQAVFLAIEDSLLRQRRALGVMHVLPPLQTLESLMFQLIGTGFFLLSLSLISGLMFLNDIFGQHLVHKTVLSVVAWLVFAVLLWGRAHFGWRGRTAIRYTLTGFISLMLAYFGSKVVLELILERVG